MALRPPLVVVPCDHRMVGRHPFHMVGEKYLTALRDGAEALPLLLPALEPAIGIAEIVHLADGLLLTGSPSNVAPSHYGGPPPRDGVLQDTRRDATTLALIRGALTHGLPLFCICRGFQELNVALGGTLHQHLAEVPGRDCHHENKDADLDVQYGPAHTVSVTPGGLVAKITGLAAFEVNSLHHQGIDRLADRLRPEAIAPDGTVEAASVRDATSFALGVQWHPEWKLKENPVSRALFRAFGDALRAHQAARRDHPHD